ncbi:MAG TPA: hypothetical protein VK162_05155 [Streptosporangiaceae bacterium]|nr:hypothetical protein [Streptosporangiaceae bacterium]
MTDPYPPGDRREEPAFAPDQARLNTVPGLLQTSGLASDATSGQTSRRYSVPPDPGCYEIRFRLTGLDAYGLSVGLLLIALSIFRYQPSLYEWVIIVALGGLLALRYVIPLVSRKILFRADPAGITLGTLGQFGFSSSIVFIPWTDIKKIALYKITRWTRRFGRTGSYMVIVPRGAAYGRARRIDTWRLDPERLAAVAAAAAPDVPVVDAGDIDPWVDADMKRVLQMISK